MALVSRSYLDSEPGAEPPIALDDLAAASGGLICLAGGAKGPLGRRLAEGQRDAAEAMLATLRAPFPTGSISSSPGTACRRRRAPSPALLDLAYAHELPIVATNDAYFPDRDFYEAHDALICIAEGRAVADNDRKRLTLDHYFRPAAEMRALFADLPEACDNTLVIARRCAFMPQSRKPILPAFSTAAGLDEERRCAARPPRVWRRGCKPAASPTDAAAPYRERLEFELDMIVKIGFAGLLPDRRRLHPMGEAPGHSGRAGPRLGRRLGRRLGADDHRSRPAALRPAVRALPQPRARVDAGFRHRFLPGPARRGDPLRPGEDTAATGWRRSSPSASCRRARYCATSAGCSACPTARSTASASWCRTTRRIRSPWSRRSPASRSCSSSATPTRSVARLMAIALKLEGLYRHASTHAAGVVIGDRPLDELVPLYRDPRSDMPVDPVQHEVGRAGAGWSSSTSSASRR